MSKTIIHHHLGLGDHIICNGLINYLSKNEKIYLICKKKYFKNLKYLYSENKNVELLPLAKFMYKSTKIEKRYSSLYAYLLFTRIKYLGFEQKDGDYFDELFYKHANINFKKRYEYFHVPEDLNNMIPIPDMEYQLIHNEASIKSYELKLTSNNLKQIYVNENLGKNIFSYINLIKNAKEIHCIDSAFIHLVDSYNLNNNLFFHDVRKDKYKFNLKNNWKVIKYN